MATPKDVIVQQLHSGQYLIDKLTADLSDAEYFRPPIPGGNHTAWIIGHIACSEDSIIAAITGSPSRLPEATHKLFKGGAPCTADAGTFPPRKQIDEMFRNSRAHTLEAVKAFNMSLWDNPSPEGWTKDVFPTLGSMWALQGTHQYWHIGQLTVCRKAMGKKQVLG